MPTYVYLHTDEEEYYPELCFHPKEFEYDQKITEDALTECPHCGVPVKRLIAGGVSVNWKGQGPPTPTFHG